MPALACSAQTCLYNQEEYCSKGDIKVGGEDAKTVTDTCCTSFVERSEDSANNSVGTPSERIDVDCEVCSCVYNDSCKCDAVQIGIAGHAASHQDETACGTFTRKE